MARPKTIDLTEIEITGAVLVRSSYKQKVRSAIQRFTDKYYPNGEKRFKAVKVENGYLVMRVGQTI